jgi:hypothetical protein
MGKFEMADQVISIADAMEIASVDAFWALRAKAIQAYSSMEQSLFFLFSQSAGVQPDIGGIIFFKITSSQARNSIIEKLIRKRHGDTFNLFWNSYLKQIRSLDIKRNEIVHWTVANEISGNDASGRPIVSVTLVRPAFFDRDTSAPSLTTKDLLEFMSKCDVFSRAVNMFMLISGSHMPASEAKPWLDMFQQPFVYPLPTGHPLQPAHQA